MKESAQYTTEFYSGQQNGSLSSARVILPIINEIFHPRSVIDVGCGVGYWLSVWKEELGVKEVLGVEGPYVKEEMLKVSKQEVLFQDLKQPLHIKRKFDLAMSLEVAEHLPMERASSFVQELVSLSDVILFSAAIEGQEGTYHINEQMPEFWSRLFISNGYVPVDYVRSRVWNSPQVEWWYQQNVLIYIKKERLGEFPALQGAFQSTNPNDLLRIHPFIYLHKLRHIKKTESFIGLLRWKLYPFKKKFLSLIKRK